MSQEKQTTEKIAITKTELSRLINDQRYKAEDVANHYGITVAQAKRAVKAAGLRFRKFHVDPFVIIDDEAPVADSQVTTEVKEEVEQEVKEEVQAEVQQEVAQTPKEESPEAQINETAQVTEKVEEVAEVVENTVEQEKAAVENDSVEDSSNDDDEW